MASYIPKYARRTSNYGVTHNVDEVMAKKLPKKVLEDDEVLTWLEKPHSITALICGGVVLLYGAFMNTTDDSLLNLKIGLGAACLVFLVICMLYLHDGPFIRPHPIVWRLVQGIAILYLLGLVILLFQNVDDARQFLKHFDSTLGEPLPERSYGEDCTLYTPHDPEGYQFRNLYDTINDEFALAHIIGWFGKTLIIRDVTFSLFLSVLFEVWELTFDFMLENFKECWWDHIILDILVCNNIGIFSAMWVLRRLFKLKEYNWTGLWGKTKKGKVLKSLTPTWDEFHWDVFSSPKRFIQVLLIVIAITIIELNSFYLKFVFWVPPPHYLNILRLLMWMFIGAVGAREYYQFVSDETCHKMGSMCWLCIACFMTELLLCIKFGYGMFPKPMPSHVFWTWIIFLVGGTIFMTFHFYNKQVEQNAFDSYDENNDDTEKEKST